MLLSGKQYLITGASFDSEIGFAICKTLSENGANLTLCARNSDSLARTHTALTSGKHDIAPFDLRQLDDISAWVKSLVSQNGAYDGIVHSASYQGYTPLKMLSPKQISQYFDINFSAAAMLIAAFSKKSHLNPRSSLVMIGSAAGLQGLKARALYAASKAALLSLVKTSAIELADKAIRVNYLAPAVVNGAKSQHQFATLGETQSKNLKDAHPLGISEPDDVANAVLFLLSELSNKTTGAVLPVDGGYLA